MRVLPYFTAGAPSDDCADVIDRLETVIFELERLDKPVLVIGHQAVNRCLLAYFRNKVCRCSPTLSEFCFLSSYLKVFLLS